MYGNHSQSEVESFEGDRIGPKMRAAVRSCRSKDYASKNQLAISVGPNGSQQYGYEIVDRCLSAGLLTLDPEHEDATPQGRGAVMITGKGERYLAECDD